MSKHIDKNDILEREFRVGHHIESFKYWFHLLPYIDLRYHPFFREVHLWLGFAKWRLIIFAGFPAKTYKNTINNEKEQGY